MYIRRISIIIVVTSLTILILIPNMAAIYQTWRAEVKSIRSRFSVKCKSMHLRLLQDLLNAFMEILKLFTCHVFLCRMQDSGESGGTWPVNILYCIAVYLDISFQEEVVW